MSIESSKQRKQRLRDERRAEQDAKYEAQREETQRIQDSCSHYQCDVTEWTWEGNPRQVVCRDCGAENYLGE